jgi:hypothetical protein
MSHALLVFTAAIALAQSAEQPSAPIPELRTDTMKRVKASVKPVNLGAGTPLPFEGEWAGYAGDDGRLLVRRGMALALVTQEGKVLGALEGAPDVVIERGGRMTRVPPFSTAAGIAWASPVREGAAPAVLRLQDGAVLTPSPRLEAEGKVMTTTLLASPESASLVLLAKDETGRTWFGAWDPTKGPSVSLARHIAGAPLSSRWDAETGAWHLFTDDSNCPRVRLVRSTVAQCLPISEASTRWVENNRGLCRESPSRRCIYASSPSASLVAIQPAPARALFAEQLPSEKAVDFELRDEVGPVGRWRYPLPGGKPVSLVRQGELFRGAVVPLSAFLARPGAETADWIDLFGGAVLHSRPASTMMARHAHRKTLVVEPGKPNDLVLLDFDTRTARVLGPVTACRGELWLSSLEGPWRKVECRSRPDPAVFRFEHLWTELVDVDRGRRFKLDLPVVTVLADGRALLTSQTQTAAESHVPRDGLRQVRLP